MTLRAEMFNTDKLTAAGDMRHWLYDYTPSGVARDFNVYSGTPGVDRSIRIAGGSAYVLYVKTGFADLPWTYRVRNDAIIAMTLDAAGSNPRIDRVYLAVKDTDFGDANNDPQIVVLKGTETSGATLSNLSGAAPLSDTTMLHLADVLVTVGMTGAVPTANIRDRRMPADGIIQGLVNSDGTSDILNGFGFVSSTVATGRYTITFNKPLAAANYLVQLTPVAGVQALPSVEATPTPQSATAFTFECRAVNTGALVNNPTHFMIRPHRA